MKSTILPVIPFVLTFFVGTSLPAAEAPVNDNPLLTESPLAYHLPPFDRIKNEHFGPAYEQGMTDQLREIEAIAGNPAPATFDNTIVALERSGQLLGRVDRTFSNLVGCNTNGELQKTESDVAPRLSVHSDAIHLNAPLFARIEKLYADRDSLGLSAESKYLLERYEKDFVRAGARLSDADKTRLKGINAQLATAQTRFSQAVLSEKNSANIVVGDRAELAGLPDNEIASAAAAAKAEGKEGKYVIRLQNTTGQPSLTSLQNRALRQRIMEASLARNSHGGPYDTRKIITDIARLRAERAALLGYANHAVYQLEEQTAGSVETVNKLLKDLAKSAVTNAGKEAADMQAIVDEEKGGFQIASWDWEFYSEKVRQARYAFDESQLKPYFELNHVLEDGVFYAANQLYGLTFKERHDLPVYQPDVRVFEVFDADGAPLALFLADNYARPSKRGGAWMNEYVTQSGLLDEKPVVANHLNIPKPPEGEPTLLTPDEVTTLFHEFGHALHGMFSHVEYPRFSGTNVPRDFVEYPSQVNEMWAVWPEVIKHYARHYKTGEPMPAELLEKMLAARKFNQGFATTEYLAAALLDQAWHQIKPSEAPSAAEAVNFEKAALTKLGVDVPTVPPRYRSVYFSHAFAGDYSAGYYSYIWSEVLDADTVEWIKLHGGLKRENGDRLRKTLLSRGGSEGALDLFQKFTGAKPDVAPLLKRRGLEEAGKAAN